MPWPPSFILDLGPNPVGLIDPIELPIEGVGDGSAAAPGIGPEEALLEIVC